MIRSQYTNLVQINLFDINRLLEKPELWHELVLPFSNRLIREQEQIEPLLTKQFLKTTFKHQSCCSKQSKLACKSLI